MRIGFNGILAAVVAAGLAAGFAPSSAFAGLHDPIVFVHGFSGWGGNFDTMIRRFKADGWTADELWKINYNTCQSVEDAAADLNVLVADVLRSTGASKVDIIAHSMGGLVAAAADTSKFNQFAALGSPFKGTDAAYLCSCASCFDMQPPGPGGCAKATWWSPCDEIINPDSSAQCGKATKTGCISHTGLLSDTKTYQGVRNYVAPK